jgi:dihydrofolate reductase/thymidylate synthase
MKWFKETTTKTQNADKRNAVVMGRRTWESIPEKFRPLPGRLNIVLSRKDPAELKMPEGVHVCGNFEETLGFCEAKKEEIEEVFVIGGSSLFDFSFRHAGCKTIYYTEVKKHFQCDTFIDRIPETFKARNPVPDADHTDNDIPYTFKIFDRVEHSNGVIPNGLVDERSHEEYQYLSLIRDVMEHGNSRADRTGTGTIAKFGAQMRFSLRDDVFPLLTTKRVFWRGVAEELLWFIAGATNGNTLTEKGVKIWDANGSREFLDKSGLNHREVGDLGPIYGFQWRHFGAEYTDMHADYSGKGVD